MFKEVSKVSFPAFTGNIKANMMPIVFGDHSTIPDNLKQYSSLIDMCDFKKGDICYLTVSEGFVPKDETQRRGGIHVEAPYFESWGGGAWGGMKQGEGIFMASSDGNTNVWDEIVEERDEHGGCQPTTEPIKMESSVLYWLTDKTPHQALPSKESHNRQFFRLVSSNITFWFTKHNTPNPYGVEPDCVVTEVDKFDLK